MTYTKCNKMCRDIKIEYPSDEQHPFSYTVIGNTVYYNLENIMTEDKIKKYRNIDRVIFNDIESYKKYVNRNK